MIFAHSLRGGDPAPEGALFLLPAVELADVCRPPSDGVARDEIAGDAPHAAGWNEGDEAVRG